MDSETLYWLSNTGALTDLAVEDSAIYVAGNTQILRLPKTGGAPTPFISNVPTPVQMVVDDSSLYWSDNKRRVLAAVKDGSSAPAQVGTGGFIGKTIQDSTSVFWIDLDGVYQMSKATLQSQHLFSNVPGFDRTMAVAAGQPYLWAAEFTGPTGSSTESMVTVYEMPDAITHYYGDSFPAAVADADHIYWVKGDALVRRAASGGHPEDVATVTPFYGLGLISDDEYVYWYDESTETISRVRK